MASRSAKDAETTGNGSTSEESLGGLSVAVRGVDERPRCCYPARTGRLEIAVESMSWPWTLCL